MSESLRIRSARPDDVEALDRLFVGRFGHALGVEGWQWKYAAGPGRAVSLVAEGEEGRLVAHAGARGLPTGSEPDAPLLWQVTDVAAVPGARPGLRPAVLDLLGALFERIPSREDRPWLFGFPGDRHHRLGERLFGYRSLPPIAEWSGDLEAAADGPGLEGTDRPGAWAEEAWRAGRASSVARTVGFLEWRYWSRPGRYYHFYRLEAPGSPAGFVAFGFRGDQARAVELWLPGPPAAYEGSLRKAAADLHEKGSRRWTFWAWPEPIPPGLAAALGLAPTDTTWSLSVRPCFDRSLLPEATEGFRYSLGDYDVE